MELVSAVITTHKREPKVVERALKSILAQTYENIEVFVVDDSPSDYELRTKVEEMVKSYPNVTYIPHEKCMGACIARNTGLNASNGTYIGFLDDDDEWKPEKTELQIKKFTDDNIALVYCGSETLNETTGDIKKRSFEIYSGMVFDKLILNNFIGSTSFPLIKTECLRNIGGFDPLQQSAQDFDVWLRLAENYAIDYVDESLVIYHIHENEQISKTSTKRIAGLERLNEKNMEYLKAHKEAYWQRIIKLAPEYSKNGNMWKALSTWCKAVVKCPFKFKENLKYLYSIYGCRKK